MDNSYIARFTSYEDYLDSLIAEEDIRYLQDGELARLIAELSYRGAGRTLTEREYDDEKERIAMAKKLKEINENAEQAGDMLGPGEGDGALVAAIKQRYKENKEGQMNSLFYLYIKGEDKEVSGHIDLAARHCNYYTFCLNSNHFRIQCENFLPYLTGKKDLVPKARDLTFLNWVTSKLRFGQTQNWEVIIQGTKVELKHREGFQVTVAPSDKRRWRHLMNKISGEETVPQWVSLNSGDKNIKINCLDVITKTD